MIISFKQSLLENITETSTIGISEKKLREKEKAREMMKYIN